MQSRGQTGAAVQLQLSAGLCLECPDRVEGRQDRGVPLGRRTSGAEIDTPLMPMPIAMIDR
jgi:hypothetical protein